MSGSSMSFLPNQPDHGRRTRVAGWWGLVWGLLVVIGLTMGCGSAGTDASVDNQGPPPRPKLDGELPEDLEALAGRLYSEPPADRAYAARELGKLGPEAAPTVPLLVDRLDDSDWLVRRQVSEALGVIGDVAAVEPLIEVVSDRSGEWGVRTAAARSLGRLGDVRAVEPLVAVLNDMNAHVRHMAVIALGHIGTPETVGPLTAAARSDSDAATRFSAAEALGRIEPPAEGI